MLSKDSSLNVQTARHGGEALEMIAVEMPNLVVTDLRMPQIDGLELVERVRRDYADIPVILMTAHGSEQTAVEALRRGAAGYVSKVRLPEQLLATVRDVLALAQASRSHQRLFDCLTRSEFEFQIDNDPQLIPAVVDLVQQNVARVALCDANGRMRIAVALEEALSNALYHGNLEIGRQQMPAGGDGAVASLAELRRKQLPYADRKIHFAAEISTTRAQFIVRDEGPGFDLSEIPDPHEAGNVERCHGRGLMLMQTFMDEVRFNETGNEVTMEVHVLATNDADSTSSEFQPGTALFRHTSHGETLVVIPLRTISSFAEDDVQREFAALRERIESGAVRNIVVDFSHLDYFGSSMLEGLRVLWKRLREHDGKLAVCRLSTVGKEILHLARFDRLFTVAETVDEAVAAVRTGK